MHIYDVSGCKACDLYKSIDTPVSGRGSLEARFAVIADFPSSEDTRFGLAYTGIEGLVVSRLLASVGLKEAEVYLTYAVKCQPATGSKLGIKDLKCCGSLHLVTELQTLLNLQYILILGATAYKAITGKTVKINNDIGKRDILFDKYHSVLLHHPNTLIRNHKMDPNTPKYKTWIELINFLVDHNHLKIE